MEEEELFLMFEEISAVCFMVLVLFMYIFYVKYPLNEVSEEDN